MSMNEMESKIRELRQLQNLIEEAQAEAEAIKDSIKAHMGDSEELVAGEYKVTWKAVTSSRLDTACPTWPPPSPGRPPPAASAWHEKSPLHQRPSKLDARGLRKPAGAGLLPQYSRPARKYQDGGMSYDHENDY